MEENNTTLYGLVGYPVSHSLSPLMHNAAFKALGVNANYKLFSLHETELDAFFSDLKEETSSIFGLNVTIPYKEKVIQYLDTLSPFAEKAKAVNTIVITNERKLVGYNTDGPGFLTHIQELGFDVSDKRISILGAGGAARAIICALCIFDKRPNIINIYDVDKERCAFLLNDLKERIDVRIVHSVKSIDDLEIPDADMLINATPLGMKEEDPIVIDNTLIPDKALVYDLVYNPSITKLLRLSEEKGARISNGLGMLFYQGVLAFQHWGDIQLDDDIKSVMRSALESGLH